MQSRIRTSKCTHMHANASRDERASSSTSVEHIPACTCERAHMRACNASEEHMPAHEHMRVHIHVWTRKFGLSAGIPTLSSRSVSLG